MHYFKPLVFPAIVTIHNLFLLTMSAILATGIGLFIVKDILQHGFFHSICSAGIYFDIELVFIIIIILIYLHLTFKIILRNT